MNKDPSNNALNGKNKDLFDKLPEQMPKDLKEKYKKIKLKLDRFKKDAVKEDKSIIGIALLPPEEKKPEMINVLVLIDDMDSKIVPDYRLKDRISRELLRKASNIDKNLFLDILLLSELRENCYDSKYELLQLIAMSSILYDPADVLSALKISEVHKSMVIKKFEKYVMSYIAAGSLFRGEKSNDIDVYVIVDDTDVKKMSRIELRDKLRSIIVNMGFTAQDLTLVKKQFHVQVYILTDFWESVKEANPVIFTFLRDGVPLYDRGVFMSWKLLLKMGRIKPSPEAIDMNMDLGDRLLERAKGRLLAIVLDDLFWAVMNPSQAALMLYGVSPPTPKETVTLLEEIFVKKEKILELKYVKTLEKIRKTFKDVEHAKIKYLTGKQIDELMNDCQIYLKRIKKLFDQIEKNKEKETFNQIYDSVIRITNDLLDTSDIKDSNIEKALKKYVEQHALPERLVMTLHEVINAKKEFSSKKLTKAESDKIKREARTYIRLLVEHLQRKMRYELENITLRFKYGNIFGEVLLFGDTVFITSDIDSKEKVISKSKINPDGSLSNFEKSNSDELEKYIVSTPIPEKVYIKEKLFEELKRLYGKDVEVLMKY